jgi:hypothetical protein
MWSGVSWLRGQFSSLWLGFLWCWKTKHMEQVCRYIHKMP